MQKNTKYKVTANKEVIKKKKKISQIKQKQ